MLNDSCVYLGSFRVNDNIYDQVINTSTDATHIRLLGENVFTVTNDCMVVDHRISDVEFVGSFNLVNHGCWEYRSFDSNISIYIKKYDLIRCEREVFIKLLTEQT